MIPNYINFSLIENRKNINNNLSKIENIENSEKPENTMIGKKRRKFENCHDNLLMIGLLHHGKK